MTPNTAKRLGIGKIPMLVENELQAMQVFGGFREHPEPESLRLLWIRNTSKLNTMWASSALLDEANAHPRIEVLSAPTPLSFDDNLAWREPAAS